MPFVNNNEYRNSIITLLYFIYLLVHYMYIPYPNIVLNTLLVYWANNTRLITHHVFPWAKLYINLLFQYSIINSSSEQSQM